MLSVAPQKYCEQAGRNQQPEYCGAAANLCKVQIGREILLNHEPTTTLRVAGRAPEPRQLCRAHEHLAPASERRCARGQRGGLGRGQFLR